jgi:predicted DNA-binding transcriptional regulator AlpA
MSAPAVAIPRLLSAREVSEATGLSIWRIHELSRLNALPNVKLGRSRWFTAELLARVSQH